MHLCSCNTCSSQESAKAKTQKEVIKTLKELKLHLPAEKRHNNKSTTLNTLKYALRCVKQVEGKELSVSGPCSSHLAGVRFVFAPLDWLFFATGVQVGSKKTKEKKNDLVVGRSMVKDLQRCRNGFQMEKVQPGCYRPRGRFHVALRHFTSLWFAFVVSPKSKHSHSFSALGDLNKMTVLQPMRSTTSC